MINIPYVPESAPFTVEQRAWLNGFLAGLFANGAAAQPAATSKNPETAEPLLVLFGSQTGTAEGLARRFAAEAGQRGFAPQVFVLNDFQPANFALATKAIIISSTWGEGDPPDNAANFWAWLKSDSAPRLEKLQFAVLGLGDRNYPEFCGASKKFDERLAELGASRLLARGECEVDYEAAAKEWIQALWPQLKPAAISTAPAQTISNQLTDGGSASAGQTASGTSAAMPKAAAGFGKNNPFPARLLANVLLNRPGSGKEVRHYELDLAESGLTYQAGDALGVLPANCPELVQQIVEVLHCRADESVNVAGSTMPLCEALTRHFDITKPSAELIAAVAAAIPDSELGRLFSAGNPAELKSWLYGRWIIDLLHLMPQPFAVSELVPLLRKLSPRLYSIASSPKAFPGQVHLTVSAVRYQCHGRERKGVASTFLADRVGDAEVVKSFVQPSSFKPPLNGDTPMIMVGPGTGIAPFRAFLQDRQASGASGQNWLFFGDQTRAADFLYESELSLWQKQGLLTRLDLAFSRDQSEKVYVQHRLFEHAAEVWTWLEQGAHFYVCGDASRMAKDVDECLHRIVQSAGGRTPEQAKLYVAELKTQKRYQRDVY